MDSRQRSVMVTGAAGHLGRAVAAAFAAQGARLALVDRDQAALDAAFGGASVKAGEAVLLAADLTNDGFVDDQDFVVFATAYDALMCS